MPVLTEYVISEQDAAGPFTEVIPTDLMKQAELPALNFRSVLEALGEKFQSSPALLKRLNPEITFKAGDRIRVPNVTIVSTAAPASVPAGAATKAAKAAPAAVKVVVSKRDSSVTVTDASGQVMFYAPVTSGSEHDPLPLGDWTVTAVSRNPVFNYNPDLFWDANPAHAKTKVPAGPNRRALAAQHRMDASD